MNHETVLVVTAGGRVFSRRVKTTGDPKLDRLLGLLVDYRLRRCDPHQAAKWGEFDELVNQAILDFSEDSGLDPFGSSTRTPPRQLSDEDIRRWVLSDESLYQQARAFGGGNDEAMIEKLPEFIEAHRAELVRAINERLGKRNAE